MMTRGHKFVVAQSCIISFWGPGFFFSNNTAAKSFFRLHKIKE